MSALDRTGEARRQLMLRTALRACGATLEPSTEVLVIDVTNRRGRVLFAKLRRAAACVVAFGLGRWLAVFAFGAGELAQVLEVAARLVATPQRHPAAAEVAAARPAFHAARGVPVACFALGGLSVGIARSA